MADAQTTKQWLIDISHKRKRQKSIIYEIAQINEERETIYDTSHALFGDDAKVAAKPSSISDPTMKKALLLCGRMKGKMDTLIFEYEVLGFEIDAARNIINKCFESERINIDEYDSILYFFFEDLTDKEIAERMGYCERTVERKRVKGIKELTKYRNL